MIDVRARKVSTRAKVLVLVCVAYFLAGLNVYNSAVPVDLIKQADPSITAHVNLFTMHQIGAVFMAATAVSFGAALWNKVEYGYALVTFLLAFWTALYAVSWVETGYWQSIYGMANYGLTLGVLAICSRVKS